MGDQRDAGGTAPAALIHDVAEFALDPADLDPARRLPGLSAYVRVKNGADFLEATLRSHIGFFDEVVVVFNQSTDGTAEILLRLAEEFGDKLVLFHYLPTVHPPGSRGHRETPPDSPHSFVNMSNLALARTTRRIAVKLDDDHLAMADRLGALTERVRRQGLDENEMWCFSGLNLAGDGAGRFGILKNEPFSGVGDFGLLHITPRTRYTHDSRFEAFGKKHLKRRYITHGYWHLKYLKPGHGFANRDIEGTGNERYQRKRDAFLANREVIDLSEVASLAPPLHRWIAPFGEKPAMRSARWQMLSSHPLSLSGLANDCRIGGLSLEDLAGTVERRP